MIVGCPVAFLQYLRLLRHRVQADIRHHTGTRGVLIICSKQQLTTDTAVSCYNKKHLAGECEGTRLGCRIVDDIMCRYVVTPPGAYFMKTQLAAYS